MSKKQIINCPYCNKDFNYYGASLYCECHHCHYVYATHPAEVQQLRIKLIQMENFYTKGERVC